jgi:hypothetical protein
MGGLKEERNKVVVRYRDGRMLKGYTHDFHPMKDTFHVVSEVAGDKGTAYDVNIADLKAVFFVETYDGRADRGLKNPVAAASRPATSGLKIRVEFFDGEVLRGTSLGYNKNKKGFFVLPGDPEDNNERVFVIAASVTDVKVGVAVLD